MSEDVVTKVALIALGGSLKEDELSEGQCISLVFLFQSFAEEIGGVYYYTSSQSTLDKALEEVIEEYPEVNQVELFSLVDEPLISLIYKGLLEV